MFRLQFMAGEPKIGEFVFLVMIIVDHGVGERDGDDDDNSK